MPRFGPQLALTTVALIGALIGGTQPVQAGKSSDMTWTMVLTLMTL